jgi:RNA polymerase sigma-70 factor (ECF subfamily)
MLMKRQNNIQSLAESFIDSKSSKSFKILYERLKPGITNHCFMILKSQELAEDAFSNTMTKIWQKIHQYDSERANFSTWTYNIARNESLLILKTGKRFFTHADAEMEYFSNKATLGDLGGQYVMEEDPAYSYLFEEKTVDTVYESVLDEIRELPEIYREIMVDREINGMKYKDIAEKYGIKKRSIATRIRRARERIRKKMDPKQTVKAKVKKVK